MNERHRAGTEDGPGLRLSGSPTVIRSPSSPNEAVTWVSIAVRTQGDFSVPVPGQTLAGRYMVFDTQCQGSMTDWSGMHRVAGGP